jgi:dolichyl-phosphate beta-glucosyltransferase
MNYIIIPLYNEENRIKLKNFKRLDECFFILVNDGSTDLTHELLLNEIIPGLENYNYIKIQKNKGKAQAIYQALEYLKTLSLTKNDTFGYIDADFSVKVDDYLELNKLISDETRFVFGSRVEVGNKVQKKKIRYLIGRSINVLISLVSGLSFYDTQCGCKLFRGDLISEFKQSFRCNWLFDVEILLKLKRENPKEVPINWKHVGGSKIKFYHLPSILLDLIKILIMRVNEK